MNITCIPNVNYFDSPQFLSTALHVITILSTPLYIFGIFIILTKTPIQMSSVKWYLVNVHTWIILFDYFLGFLTIPFVLIPLFVGHPLGILRHFGLSTLDQTIVGFAIFGCKFKSKKLIYKFSSVMITSIIVLFENRFHQVCMFRNKHYWTMCRKKWICVHYITVIVMLIPFKYLCPDQQPALQRTFQVCTPKELSY